ncbi:MAG: hypothetical protein ACFE9S_10200 [Candidatus Hermodarchaeota archaeon]
MVRKTRQKLINDGVRKECGICHQLKTHDNFSKRQERLRSICEECRKDLYLINNLKKKLKIITEDYNGECSICKKSITILPAFEFHHPDPKSKSFSWKSLRLKSYQDTLRLLKEDKVILLCKNCHILMESVNYKVFKSLILLPALFLHTPDEIKDKINSFLEKNPYIVNKLDQNKYYKSKAKYQIKKWIKKRYIIEKLFYGKCVGCEEITVQTNLPSLGFHHILPPQKEVVIKWDKISRLNIKEIAYLLKTEKCICLCSNCHSILHSKHFISNIDTIFGNKYKPLVNQAKSDYNRIIINIKNYDIEKNLNNSLIKDNLIKS